jgi:hypothetical protein
MRQRSVVMEQKMTTMQWIAGSSVIVAVTICGLISSEIVNSNIPAEPTVASQNQNENVGAGICFTLGGKQFEWHFPNVPFGILRCSK